jgi:hypothetical protein
LCKITGWAFFNTVNDNTFCFCVFLYAWFRSGGFDVVIDMLQMTSHKIEKKENLRKITSLTKLKNTLISRRCYVAKMSLIKSDFVYINPEQRSLLFEIHIFLTDFSVISN